MDQNLLHLILDEQKATRADIKCLSNKMTEQKFRVDSVEQRLAALECKKKLELINPRILKIIFLCLVIIAAAAGVSIPVMAAF